MENEYSPMILEQIKEDFGSYVVHHIEPALDNSWSDLDKLRWKTGVVLLETGCTIKVAHGDEWHNSYKLYGLGWGCSVMSYLNCWTWLNGFVMGFEESRKVETDEEHKKRQLKRKARAYQKKFGVKYTEALRAVKKLEGETDEHAAKS